MICAVSPYHLATRDGAAVAALVLAERVVTTLPVPAAGPSRESVRLAMRSSPRFGRLLEAWRWSVPLWEAGVVGSLEAGEDAAVDARACGRRLVTEAAWHALLGFAHPEFFEDLSDLASPARSGRALDLLCADLVRGGPDPGIALPMLAGLDALARRHRMVAVRAGGAPARKGLAGPSAAQRAEALLGAPALTVALPVALAAGAEEILEVREALQGDLAGLRGAMAAAFAAMEAGQGAAALRNHGAELRSRAAALTAAVARLALAGGTARAYSLVRLTGCLLPADSAFMSAAAAAVASGAQPAKRNGTGGAPATGTVQGPLRAWFVEPIAGVAPFEGAERGGTGVASAAKA
jgi:hypothetical protein